MAQTLQIMRFDTNDGYYYVANEITMPVDESSLEDELRFTYNVKGSCDWEIRHYEIGDGESGTDYWISDEDFKEMIDDLDDDVFDRVELEIELRFGYDVMEIQSDSGNIWVDYDDEDEYEDDIDGEYL